jgi:hypothetical protein
MTTTTADVSGYWLGTYWQTGQPIRFEANLVQGGSVLDGRILDNNYLGEAWLTGELLGERIFFVKRYVTTSPNPIRYTGTLSEDGNHMHGKWRIGYFDSGQWEAFRVHDPLSEALTTLRSRLAEATNSGLLLNEYGQGQPVMDCLEQGQAPQS